MFLIFWIVFLFICLIYLSILYIYLIHLFIYLFLFIYLLFSAFRHPPSVSTVRFLILQTSTPASLHFNQAGHSGFVPLGGSGSRSLITDHSDHSARKERDFGSFDQLAWQHARNTSARQRIKKGWALDPIDRSPFLPSWNLHKVEMFSAFISYLNDISSWKCSRKCKSLQFERKRFYLKTMGFEPIRTQMVQCTTLTTRPLKIWSMEVKEFNYI